MDETTPIKKRTLAEILQTFADLEAEFSELTPEEIEELKGELVTKIDNTKLFLDTLRARAGVFADYGCQFSAKAKALENRADSLENYVLIMMQKSGWTELRGEHFRVEIKKSKFIDILRQATAMDAIRQPEFVRKSWEWDKRAIGEYFKKTGETTLIFGGDEVGRVSERPSVSFSINKEGKK